MTHNVRSFGLLVLALAALGGCSSAPPASEQKKQETPLQKIQGKVQLVDPSQSGDAPLNPGGPTVYLWEGKQRYRLFSRKAAEVVDGKEYVVEGVNAQKVIDEIGDPAPGKNTYPLLASCERVVKMAWRGMSFDEVDVKATVLRARVARYPARPIFLVVRIQPATAKDEGKGSAESKKGAADKDATTVSVAAEKQSASLLEGSLVQPAPLWEAAGGTIRCKVLIGTDGKFSELETGAQLCEAFDWSKLRYQPLVQGGRPVQVRTEVEVKFEARK